MVFAGRDATASARVWCNLMLNNHLEIGTRIRKELQVGLPRLFEDQDYVPSLDEVDLLIDLDACIRETLRLDPIAPLLLRQANRDTTLSDGTSIAKGTKVFFPPYALGRMKHVWGEGVLEFKPERWIATRTSRRSERSRPSSFQLSTAVLASASASASALRSWSSRLSKTHVLPAGKTDAA